MSARHALPFASVFLVLVAPACHRLPPSARMEAAEQATVRKAPPTPAAPRTDDELLDACRRACGNWVSLRFAEPRGVEALSADAARRVRNLVDEYRASNRARCEEACLESRRTDRARCIAAAEALDELLACRSL